MKKIKEFITSYFLEMLCVITAIMLIVVKLTTNVYAEENVFPLPSDTNSIINNSDYKYYVCLNISNYYYIYLSNEELIVKDNKLILSADSKLSSYQYIQNKDSWGKIFTADRIAGSVVCDISSSTISYANYTIVNSDNEIVFYKKLPILLNYDMDKIERTNIELTNLNSILTTIKNVSFIILLLMMWDKINSIVRKWVKKC